MHDSIVGARSLTWQDTAYFGPVTATTPDVQMESLFHGHALRVSDAEMLPMARNSTQGWTFPVIIGLVMLVLITKLRGGVNPVRVLRASVDGAMLNALVRIGTTSEQRVPVLLLFVGMVSIALFLSAASDRVFGGIDPGLLSLLENTVLVAAFLMGTRWLNRIIGDFLGNVQLARSYAVIQSVLISSLGMVLLPFTMVMFHGPEAWKTWMVAFGIALLSWFFVSDAIRSASLLWGDKAARPHHIIYYFCALKILPLSIVLRVVLGN